MPTPSVSTSRSVGVIIVEDQTAIREMLVAYVTALPGFTVVGEAATVAQALQIAGERHPDVVVLDWMLLGGIGLDFLREMRGTSGPNVLVFSANTTELAIREALAAGAKGYVEKTASFAEFKTALCAVAAGQTYVGPAVASAVQKIVSNPDRLHSNPELSARERDVLRFIASGLSSKEIATELGLSVRTVENHRANIMRRTGLRSIAHLTLHALRLGLIETPAAEPERAVS